MSFNDINNFSEANLAVESITEISNSLHCRASIGSGFPTGYRDNVLAKLLIPFTYCTVNEYWSVFSLKFKSLGFDISCSVLSPNILMRGLWSTNMVK